MPRWYLLVLVLAGAAACTNDRADQTKVARILASDDRRLTDLVAAWVGKPGVAQTASERTLADVVHVFEIVGDAGLASFLDDPQVAPSPERARDALNEVGLSSHAKIFVELLGARGPQGVPHATLLVLEDRFRALADPAQTLAKYIRAHATDLRLGKLNEKALP